MPKPEEHDDEPWSSPRGLVFLRSAFYPRHIARDPYKAPVPDMRQRAVGLVRQWESGDRKVPHAVTATAHLTEALLHDTDELRDTHGGGNVISDWALRAIYAMAFVRFVNGFVDRDVAKSAKRALLSSVPASPATQTRARSPNESAVSVMDRMREQEREQDREREKERLRVRGDEGSMYAHAAAIGMPEGFVDLRHRATHDEMPGLGELRSVVGRGLEWLWVVWWSREVTGEFVGEGLGGGEGLDGDEGQDMGGETEGMLAGDGVDEDLLARQTEAEGEVDMDVDDGLCVVCRNRKRDGSVDAAREGEEGPQAMTYKERLLWNKRKRKRPKTAFGLFETP